MTERLYVRPMLASHPLASGSPERAANPKAKGAPESEDEGRGLRCRVALAGRRDLAFERIELLWRDGEAAFGEAGNADGAAMCEVRGHIVELRALAQPAEITPTAIAEWPAELAPGAIAAITDGPAEIAAEGITARLAEIARPRPPVAGLAMDRVHIMGIVNVTPDSFSDGGRHWRTQDAVDHALRLAEEGADILDIGGESTRPGATPVPEDEELGRVMPVIEALQGRTEARLSIDTRKARVMAEATAAGVHFINDVSALGFDENSAAVAAESGAAVILMHARGDPRTMQVNPHYGDVLLDVYDALEARLRFAEAAGIDRARLIVDPGIGFGKTVAHNLRLLAGLALFHGLGVPLLLGASRKSFIGHITGEQVPERRLGGSLAAALWAAVQGAQILRVHDVEATRQALRFWQAVCQDGAEA